MINLVEFCDSLRTILVTRIHEGKLVIPVLPDAVAKVQTALQDPNYDVGAVTAVLERDPVLAAQIIQTSNSAAFARAQRIESIRKAVSLLGARTLRGLLLTTVSRQIFTSRIARINDALHLLWDHSLTVGLLSQDVAGLVECTEPDAAYLAGLLHDVGQAIVGIYVLEVERSTLEHRDLYRSDFINHELWQDVVREVHRPVSVALAEKWSLSSAVCEAITRCDDYDPGNRRSIGNVVRFTDALATQMGMSLISMDPNQLNALVMIGRSLLGLDEDVVLRISSQAKRLVDESHGGLAVRA